MSSESEPEEFFDACDITPQKGTTSSCADALTSGCGLCSMGFPLIVPIFYQTRGALDKKLRENGEDTTTGVTEPLEQGSHYETALEIEQEKIEAKDEGVFLKPTGRAIIKDHTCLKNLDNSAKKLPKEEISILVQSAVEPRSGKSLLDIVKTQEIRIEEIDDSLIPLKASTPSSIEHDEKSSVETLAASRKDTEDCGSACSGSLLGNLGDDDDDEVVPRTRPGGRRRNRHRDVRGKLQQEDDDPPYPPSPQGSQSSSIEGVYAGGKISHPFRVVEHGDTASIYSSVSLGKVGKILSGADTLTIKDGEGSVQESAAGKSAKKLDSKPEPSLLKKLPSDCLPEESRHPEEHHSWNGFFLTNTLFSAYCWSDGRSVAMSPEPDLVASTKSSSGSDKSNSLPRGDPEVSSLQENEVAVSEVSGEQTKQGTSPVNPEAEEMATKIEDSSPILADSSKVGHSQSHKNSEAVPIAPPRRRKRRQKSTEDTESLASVSSLPSPTIPSCSVDTISIGHSLDLRQAVRGDYVVKPQDSEQAKAVGPTADELARLEAEDTTSQASTPEVSRAPSRTANTGASTPASLTATPTTAPTPNTPSSELGNNTGSPSTEVPEVSLMVRTRSDSGKELTDAEILQQVPVLNLDTGERIPLSEAENRLPQALNPLSLHIMRLTSEYVSTSSVDHNQESDEESIIDVNVKKPQEIDSSVAVRKKTSQFKQFLGRKMESAVNKARSLAHEVYSRHKEEKDVFEDDAPAHDTMQYVKIKTAHSHKGPHEFDNLMYVQEITGEHTGPVWCMKFSGCGRLLATAGQDHILRVWVLKQAFNYFLDIRTKCNADIKVSPTPSQESLVSQHSGQSGEDMGSLDPNDDGRAPFMPKPFCVYAGHTADMLDISWSKNYFILTSSMDKTVRLWHISRKECLCIFQHMDFVTAIAFHPKDDRYFISGALDGKLRLWSIPDKRVVLWNEVGGSPNLITAANFCQNGKFTVVGTYDGRCIFYETEQLKYFTQINVRSTRGKNAKGRKITGIEPLPGEDKVLITSNDSRIRLYDLRDLGLSCKYKGYSNVSSQIRAGFSHDGKFIVAGSENQCIYIWKTHHDYSKFSSARRDRNIYWEGVKAHSAVVTCAVFAPHPDLVFRFIEQQETLNKATQPQNKENSTTNKGYVMVSADFNGCIKVFLKKEKPKHSSLPASAMA